MEKGHSQNIDPRPKRRIDKDNPYRLFTVGAATSEPHYFIQFKDGAGIEHCLEIEKPLYDLFDQFELDDLSYMNEVDRHCEKEEQTEASINRRAVVRQETPEMAVLRQLESKELHSAILKLPEIQRRRLILYYYGELDGDQISVIEGCSKSAVSQTLSIALKALRGAPTSMGRGETPVSCSPAAIRHLPFYNLAERRYLPWQEKKRSLRLFPCLKQLSK